MTFRSFRSTVTPLVPRRVDSKISLLLDPDGSPVGFQSTSANGPDGMWTPTDLTAGQIAAPSAEIIADLNATYRLNVAPYARYRSNGAALISTDANGSSTGLVTLTQPATGATITIADTKTLSVVKSITLTGTDGTTHTFPATNATVAALNIAQAFTAGQFFYGGVAIGNGTGAQVVGINGAAAQNRGHAFATNGVNRWQALCLNDAETGNSTGSSYFLGSYSDTGVFLGTAISATRASGPLGSGPPLLSHVSSWTQSLGSAVAPGGVVGNQQTLLSGDTQPAIALSTNPLTTTFPGTPTVVTVALTGASTQLSTSVDTWVNIVGATAVGGITPSGWVRVTSVATNSFTFTWTSPAASAASGGGSSVTVTPSFPTQINKSYATATSGGHGFSLQHTSIYDVKPSFYQLVGNAGPQYMMRWSIIQSPPDNSQTFTFGTCGEEFDLVNRSGDEGYNPDLYAATRPSIGLWYGPSVPLVGVGTTYNWNTVYAVYQGTGGLYVYGGLSVQKNALTPASIDPNAHGGVGTEIFGAYTLLVPNPFLTATGTSVVTVSMQTTGDLSAQVNGGTVYIPTSYTISGVTFGAGTYTMSNVNLGTGKFTITGSGAAAGNVSGGGTNAIVSFLNQAPYSAHQVWGEWTTGGLVAHSTFRSDNGLFIRSIPGAGVGWYDGTGTAVITGTELSAGNIEITLTPAGTGTVNAAGLLKLKSFTVATLPAAAAGNAGCLAYVTDATAPTYRGALTGGGAVKTLVFSDGAAWTSH